MERDAAYRAEEEHRARMLEIEAKSHGPSLMRTVAPIAAKVALGIFLKHRH